MFLKTVILNNDGGNNNKDNCYEFDQLVKSFYSTFRMVPLYLTFIILKYSPSFLENYISRENSNLF